MLNHLHLPKNSNPLRLFQVVLMIWMTCWTFSAQASDGGFNQTDSNGRRQGYWIITGAIANDTKFAATAKVEEGNYVDSRREGVWKRYWPSGKIRSEIAYSAGKPHGWYKTYYENGQTEEESQWYDNKNVGLFQRYHMNGTLQQHFNFNQSGKREGPQYYYHENGVIEMEVTMLGGVEQGVMKRYNADGSLAEEKTYDSGKVNPNSVKTFAGVKKQTKVEDPYDPTVGQQVAPSEDKTNKADVFHPNGYNTLYSEEGFVTQIGEFKEGKLWSGKWYKYNKEGIMIKVEIYKGGRYIGAGVISEKD
jgi:antitoxin component YwqK of YwqJK toxin-antitoxin module